MATKLYLWALEERVEIAEQIKWFNAGSVLTSPSGDDITAMKLGQLGERLRDSTKLCAMPIMPKGPRGEKRPADAIGRAVMIGRIATGEIEDVRR